MEATEFGTVKVGEVVPVFGGKAFDRGEIRKISRVDYKNKWIVLFFWPEDFTFVCPTEIKGFQERLKDFEKKECQVLGCSVDSVHSHKAWVEHELKPIDFPLIGDIDKKVSSLFGVLNKDGVALRGTFIIDPKGILQSATINNLDVGRNVDETLRLVDGFQSGGLCPVNWKMGQKTLERK